MQSQFNGVWVSYSDEPVRILIDEAGGEIFAEISISDSNDGDNPVGLDLVYDSFDSSRKSAFFKMRNNGMPIVLTRISNDRIQIALDIKLLQLRRVRHLMDRDVDIIDKAMGRATTEEAASKCIRDELMAWENKRESEIEKWCDDLAKKGEECRISAGQEELEREEAIKEIEKQCK